MSDSKQSISGKGKYEEGWLGVNPLEKEKKEKEEALQKDTSAILYSAFLVMLKQFTVAFATLEHSLPLMTHKEIDELISLRKLLQILSVDDQSHNPEFTELLSEVWHDLLQTNLAKIPEFSSLKEDIQAFPATEEHSLGFYLAADVGKEWHPFPFMEMLRMLYKDHQNNPLGSELHHWITLLDQIITKQKET